MSTESPCERHLFGADGQCVGCGKMGAPKTTAMSMTPERLSQLRVIACARGFSGNPELVELCDAVEALQAELAEERANHRVCHDVALMWRKRCAEDGDIANLAMRVGLEMVEETTRRATEALTHAWNERNEVIQRAEKAERERDRYLADANEYALQIHDLRARLAACVEAFEEFVDDSKWGDRADFSAAMRAIAAAKGGA